MKTLHKTLLLTLAFALAIPAAATEEKKDTTATSKKSSYEKIVEKQTDRQDGMFTLILSGGKVYFGIPEPMLGREYLLGSTVKATSDNANGIVGSKTYGGLKHITFEMRDSTLLMREVESEYISPDEGISQAISKSNIGPILKAFELKAKTPEGLGLYDVTALFLEHDAKSSPFLSNGAYSSYERKESFKKDLSFLSGIKAFEDNVSVTSTMSYTYTMTAPKSSKPVFKDQPFTAQLTRSILLLPEKTYTPREGDYRIGYFHTEREQLGSVMNSTKTVYLTNRWRLEPSDTAAFRRGELVEPIKPITFYVDSDFPQWWKPYIREAILTWNDCFELCGFKNAVVVKDFPTDDPSFDPDNIKYSCVRYAPIGIQNASGPSWVDPRSGEIITASVYVYHDVIKLLSRWLFVQTAQTDERVRHSYIPQDVLGDAIQYVISHEVGHCLGLMHNMSASTLIPVDSLRSPAYTQQHGTTTSIMDYARFNYVAQPGDMQKGVRMSPPRLGEYDKYAIRWGYTPVWEADGFKEQGDITSGWITDSLKVGGFYKYGKQQMYSAFFDPRCQNEDLGDDVVKASRYGVANLKYITENLMDWAADDDPEYKVRLDYYNGILSQYLQYSQHVLMNVGGLYKDEVKAVDNLPTYSNIPREHQLECLDYLFEMAEDLGWVAPKSVISRLPIVGSPERSIRKSIQSNILVLPFFASKSDGVVSKELSSAEIFDIIFDHVWGPTSKGKKLSAAEREFQNLYVTTYLANAGYSVKGSKAGLTGFESVEISYDSEGIKLGDLMYSPVDGYEWSPRAIFNKGDISQATIYAQMIRVHELLEKKAKRANATDKAHYQMLTKTIENALGL